MPDRDRSVTIAVRPSLRWWIVIALAAVAAAAFVPALNNGFIAFDDDENFIDNAWFRGLGWSQIRWAWTTFLLGVYQPLAWMILELEYLLGGLNPRGYHLASIGMHAAVAVALFVLIVAILRRCGWPAIQDAPREIHLQLAAALAAALFAVHPLRVEVVAWASCQPYLPCALFSILTILAHLRAHDEPAGAAGSAAPGLVDGDTRLVRGRTALQGRGRHLASRLAGDRCLSAAPLASRPRCAVELRQF